MLTGSYVVVGVDGGPDGLRAVDYAAAWAMATGKALRLVHGYHVSAAINPVLPAYGLEELREGGRQALATAVQRVHDISAELPVDTALVMTTAPAALVSVSKDASMVVLGRRSRHGVQRLLSGSTSSAVAARARVPVVVVPVTWSSAHQQDDVVVGDDGSPQARNALAFGFAEAARRGVGLTVVRVWDPPQRWLVEAGPLDDEPPEWRHAMRQALSQDIADVAARYADVPVALVVERSSSAASSLLRQGEEASLLVIGARGHGGLHALDMGFTARSVLAHSTAPVAVVHRNDALVAGRVAGGGLARPV